jgi:hypothetical protein
MSDGWIAIAARWLSCKSSFHAPNTPSNRTRARCRGVAITRGGARARQILDRRAVDDRIDTDESLRRHAALHGLGHRREDALRIALAQLRDARSHRKFDQRSERLHRAERESADALQRRAARRRHRGTRFHGVESAPALHGALQLEPAVSRRQQLATRRIQAIGACPTSSPCPTSAPAELPRVATDIYQLDSTGPNRVGTTLTLHARISLVPVTPIASKLDRARASRRTRRSRRAGRRVSR